MDQTFEQVARQGVGGLLGWLCVRVVQCLQDDVVSQSFYLLHHVEDVLVATGLVGDDHPEEVGRGEQGLVADHQVTLVHHPPLDDGRHLTNTNTHS